MRPTRGGSLGAVLAVTLSLGLGLAACAAPEGSQARPVDSDIAQLLTPDETPSPEETVAPAQAAVEITWVRGDRLVQVLRLVAARTRQEKLNTAFDELRLGPRPTEQRRNMISLLPPDLVFTGVIRGRRVVIDVERTGATQQSAVALATGQLATTALAVPGVRAAKFTVNGAPTRVEVPEGGQKRVVQMSDYRRVLF